MKKCNNNFNVHNNSKLVRKIQKLKKLDVEVIMAKIEEIIVQSNDLNDKKNKFIFGVEENAERLNGLAKELSNLSKQQMTYEEKMEKINIITNERIDLFKKINSLKEDAFIVSEELQNLYLELRIYIDLLEHKMKKSNSYVKK